MKEYHKYWHEGEPTEDTGIAILSKEKAISVKYGLPNLDKPGLCLTAEYKKYYFVCVDTPHHGQ